MVEAIDLQRVRPQILSDQQGRIQHQFLEDPEGWIRCHSAETGAGSDPTRAMFRRAGLPGGELLATPAGG